MIKKLIKITSRYLQNVSVVKRYVYLDNKHINEVILADDVEGWVVIPKKDANNQLMVDDCGNLITETLYGKVEVKIG